MCWACLLVGFLSHILKSQDAQVSRTVLRLDEIIFDCVVGEKMGTTTVNEFELDF